jgi:hypothetical protein
MAANMGLIAKKCFPNATRVTDRFRAKNSTRGLTRNQIKYRWQAIDQENEAIEKLEKKKKFELIMTNGALTITAAISYTRTNQSGLKPNRTSPSII